MNTFTKRFKIFILVTGVLCLLFSSIILYFSVLDELDSIYPLAFESVDVNNLSLLPEQLERIIAPISIFGQALNTSLIASIQVLGFFFHSPSPDSKPLVLRC